MKRVTVFMGLLLWFAAVSQPAAGQPSTLARQRLALKPARKAQLIQDRGLRLLALGKEALVAKDVAQAYTWFSLAKGRLGQQHDETNFYVAITRLLLLPMEQQPLAASLGFRGLANAPLTTSHLNPLNLTALPPRRVTLPSSLARGSDWQELVAAELAPLLEDSLTELNRIPSGFVSLLPVANPLAGVKAIEIDDADIALLRCGIHLALAQVRLTQVYNVDVDLQKTADAFHGRAADKAVPDVLARNPSALRLQDGGQAQRAKADLIDAITDYLTVEFLMNAERDDQSDDLFAYSLRPADVKKAQTFKLALADLKKSLEGMPDALWTVTIDQVLDVGRIFDRPLDLRALGQGRSIQTGVLVEQLLYQTQYALANLKKAPPTFSQRVDPDNIFDLSHKRHRDVEVDYGDVLALKATLESLHAALAVIASYNMEVDLEALAPKAMEPAFSLETDVLSRYPLLLRVQDPGRLADAKLATTTAVQAALDASDYLRLLDDRTQGDDLVPYQGDFVRQETAGRRSLIELRSTLQTTLDPHPTQPGEKFTLTLNLSPIFQGQRDLRDLLPTFSGVVPLPNSLPDPTLGGVTPTLTQSDWTARVWPEHAKYPSRPNGTPRPARSTLPARSPNVAPFRHRGSGPSLLPPS